MAWLAQSYQWEMRMDSNPGTTKNILLCYSGSSSNIICYCFHPKKIFYKFSTKFESFSLRCPGRQRNWLRAVQVSMTGIIKNIKLIMLWFLWPAWTQHCFDLWIRRPDGTELSRQMELNYPDRWNWTIQTDETRQFGNTVLATIQSGVMVGWL